jgi:hypothetical protein
MKTVKKKNIKSPSIKDGKESKAKMAEPTLSRAVQEALIHFLEHHSAKMISKNLRRMLVEYLMQNVAGESIYLYETLKGLHGLFELLDVAEEEWHPNSLNG